MAARDCVGIANLERHFDGGSPVEPHSFISIHNKNEKKKKKHTPIEDWLQAEEKILFKSGKIRFR